MPRSECSERNCSCFRNKVDNDNFKLTISHADFLKSCIGSYVGEVVKAMDKKKVLVKVHPEGKFVVDVDKNIDINDVTPNCRVALRNDSYTLHKILPNKVDPLVCVLKLNFYLWSRIVEY